VPVVADQRDGWSVTKNIELGAVWLVKRGEEIVAFSVVCPHLGCSINANAHEGFACPCHTSAFDRDGRRVSGPAPRDMDRLATKIEDSVILVDFRRFRIGVAAREEIGV
jgi:Rieske Fe-S protein